MTNKEMGKELIRMARKLFDRDVRALAEVMERVLADEGKQREMRERGLRQAAKFPWERAARETMEVYWSVAWGEGIKEQTVTLCRARPFINLAICSNSDIMYNCTIMPH